MPRPAAIPSFVALRRALRPLRNAAEVACLAGRGAIPPVVVAGFTIVCKPVRRARPVCGVPAPYAFYEFWYEAREGAAKFTEATSLGEFVARFRQALQRRAEAQDAAA